MIEIYVDGACKGNHDKTIENKAYICVIVPEKDLEFIEKKKWLTNNEAEWEAFLESLKISRENKWNNVKIYSDSKLVVEQYNERWQCKNEKMMGYYIASKSIGDMMEVELVWVRRDKNLAGIILDMKFG